MSDTLETMLANPRSRVYRDEDDGTLYVLLNDFFCPAADAEEIPPGEVAEVLARWSQRGWWGILGWVIQRRYVSVVRAAPREPSPAAVDAAYGVSERREGETRTASLERALRAAYAVDFGAIQ